MDGRGRPGTNSSSTSSASVMSSYYGSSTPGDSGSGSYSSRECFWSQTASGAPTATPVDPWSANSYGQPLLPAQSPSYNNNSPPNNGNGSFNIPSAAPYPPRIPPVNGTGINMNGNGTSHGEMSPFPGPSPPNPMQPQPVPYGAPPQSSRQYTPSTTPSPHVQQSPNQAGNVNGVNGNSLSSHSSHENSPPNSGNNNTTFDLGYMNGGGSSGVDMNSSKTNGPTDAYPPPQMPYYQNYPNQYDSQNMAPSYYESFGQNQQRRQPFDPYHPYPNANSGYNEPSSYASNEEYNSGVRTNQDSAQIEANGRRRDSISGLEMIVENGTKMDSCDSMHSQRKNSSSQDPALGLRSSFDEEPSFESVLHGGHQNNYGSHSENFRPDHDSNSSNFQSPSYSNLDAPSGDNNQKGQALPTQGDDKNRSIKPSSLKRREKRRRNRSSAIIDNGDDRGRKKGNKDKSFGNPQSPTNSNSNSNQSTSSNQSRKQQSKSEGESNSQSEGGDRSPSNSNDNNDSTSKPGSSENSSNIPNTSTTGSKSGSSRKRTWKKAKQVNSEQLLEERERNCAEYIENSHKLKSASTSSDGSSKKVKEEPIIHLPPISSCRSDSREEKNITIDHQKDEVYKHRGSFDGDDDDSSTTLSKHEKKDVPLVECGCFPIDEVHPEPGPFYTHLGAAHTLPELRELLETRTGFRAAQLRFEKVIYTGKEGKTSQGCPLAKWIIRRGSYEEQLLFLVKHRKGHKCATAWIVVCCVIWEAVPPHFADNLYDTLVYKLNRFGVPTTRRSDTNEQRSCACNGVDPDTCGAAYSFGCAWSMFFNGCKYARSRNVRKFRLTEEHEEAELEEKVQHLATHLAPLYERVASDSYRNQIDHEGEGLECRLGYRAGRPFSGVTACLDYCSHAHKDAHNMINGCTVTVAFTRNRTLTKADDEQFHVLPLYKLDESDEYGSKEGQKQKIKKGQLEILKKFPTKVRVRKVPLLPSRRRGKPNKPAGSSGGSNSSHSSSQHNHTPKSDSYSSDLPSLSMPPPMKREKMSIFDELNGPAGGSDLFDSRFPHGPTPSSHFSNLLLSKSHSKLGMGMGLPMSHEEHVQSCQISSTVLDSEGHPQSIWNSPYGQLPQGGHSHSHAQQGGSFRSYFDTPLPPTSQYSSKPASQFGSFDFHLSSTPRTGGTAMNHNTSIESRSGSSNVNPNNIPNNMPNAPSAVPPSGYSSMSPSILPSFRHTFMTEAESLSMLSSMSSPTGTGSPIADSTSSPRSGKPGASQQLNLSAPTPNTPITPFSHHSDNLNLSGAPSYFNPTAPIVPPNPYSNSASSNLYHPHPHHPTPSSCLPSAPNQVGVPFNSSTSYANSSSSFGPHPPSMDPHHSFSMGMNMNPIPSWNPNAPTYSHHGYGSVPPPAPATSSYHHPHNQMSSLGMNSMTPPSFPHMNQYNPYSNQFMSSHSALHSHHPPAPWVSPIPSFMQGAHGHPPPPAPSCFVTPPKPKVIPEVNETTSDNEDAFKDSHLGGVGIALTHGAVILQCAKHEMHATTSLKNPNRMYPSRICLVFYQHKSMNNRFHGWSEWEKKIEAKKLQEVKLINQGKLEASPRKMKQLIKEGYIADNQ